MSQKVLATHTDRFSLFEKVRKGKQNNRNYMLEAVKSMINSPETQEGLRLGELYGYYGHTRRVMTGNMELPETAVVMVEGKAVVLDNVPSNRTVELSVDDDGVVTHTEEIFETPTGKIVASMLESRAGGWSWVTTGRDSPAISIPKAFYGFDYVTMPNFISKDHPAAMHECADSRTAAMLESLQNQGFSSDAATSIIEHYDLLSHREAMIESVLRVEELESTTLIATGQLLAKERELEETRAMLESLRTANAQQGNMMEGRKSMLAKALDRLPVFVTERHRSALANMQTEDDLAVAVALFESLSRPEIRTLPLHNHAIFRSKKTNCAVGYDDNSIVSFTNEVPRFE